MLSAEEAALLDRDKCFGFWGGGWWLFFGFALSFFPHFVSLFPFINALGFSMTQIFKCYHDKNMIKNMEITHDL